MLSYIPHKNNAHSWRTSLFIFFVLCVSAGIAYSLQAYSQNINTSASIFRAADVGPKESITIDFSFPVIPATVEKNFSVFPKQEVSFKWENGNRRVVVQPLGYWKIETQYEISISGGKNIFFRQFDQKINFSTKKYPSLKKILPLDGEKNVAIDIEEPISVSFDSSLEEYNVKFVVNPSEELDYQVSDDKMRVSLLAKSDFEWKIKYTIAVFIKYNEDPKEDYKKISETTFETAPPPASVVWDKNLSVRIEQAKQFTKPQISSGKYIDINLKQQVMAIFENGQPLDAYIISSGKKGMETPEGSFKIENKATRAWSKKYELFMPNWMAFVPSGEYGIHELPEWPGGYKEGSSHLGTPVSHGCVRLGVGAAKRVWDWAEIGTPVVIHL